MMVDNSGSMWARTGNAGTTNSCGFYRTRINDVACVLRNVSDGVGDATFGFGMFRTQCDAALNVTVRGNNYTVPFYYVPGADSTATRNWSCNGGSCPNAFSAPAASAFPAYPFPTYGCAGSASVVVPLNNSVRNQLRNWGDGAFTSCTAYTSTGTLGGPELAMRQMPWSCSNDGDCRGICEGGRCWDGADATWTPLAGSMRAAFEYLSGSSSPFRNSEGTGQPDPYARCRPVSVISLTDGDETCWGNNGTLGDALNAANIGCLQVDLNGNGTWEDPIPQSDPNPALRGLYERNRDLNSDGDCYDAGEQRAFRTRVYSMYFADDCNSKSSIENVAQRGGVAQHGVACANGAQRYGYYARSEEEIAQAINQIVADSQLIETCNALDDDCDTRIDETFAIGTACGAGVGACRRDGVLQCAGDGQGTVCSVSAGSPGNENNDALCQDGIDNDCDGFIDCGDPNCASAAGCAQGCAPSSEICDGRDNDCDTRVDEGGFTRACGSTVGLCTPGVETCETQASPGSGVARWVGCTGTRPMMELCNGLDENCNGVADDGVAIGAVCGPASGLCRPGQEQCVGGRVVCVGGVPSQREVCDCLDNDCDSRIDEDPEGSPICPGQSRCMGCQCALRCQDEAGEFAMRCPAGRLPEERDGMCFCVNPPCTAQSCAAMTIERNGQVFCAPGRTDVVACQCALSGCMAPCEGRVCGNGLTCDLRDPEGRCVENNCRGLGCPTGQACNITSGICEADACASVTCANGQACRQGICEASCAEVTCPQGQRCSRGVCAADRCAGVSCAPDQTCDPANSNCSSNRCSTITCRAGEVCDPVSGACATDPCSVLHCATGQTCVRGECQRPAPPVMEDAGTRQRVLASGGGPTCSASRGHTNSLPLWSLLVVLACLAARPLRKKSARISFAVLLAGCTHEAYCLDCNNARDATIDLATSDRPAIDIGTVDTTPSECVVGSQELCNGRDDDCDRLVDEGIDTQTSIQNCGACGNVCAPDRAFGRCTAGACQIASCDVGAVDIDGNPNNGCEYACLVRFTDDSVCNMNDDDCDMRVDENVMLSSDALNCGRCGTVCTLANASARCINSMCAFEACLPGFYDFDGNTQNGCEAQCSPSGGGEQCNGIDDDCDSRIDETVTVPQGFTCRSMGPCAGATATCMGALGFRCNYAGNVEVDQATGQPVALERLCDDLDGNCNGSVDETFSNKTRTCNNGGVGACAASGTFVCNSAHDATACNAPAVGNPGSEIADGLDNDCDGVSDENRSAPGSNPSYVQTAWVQYANNEWVMQYEASRADASAGAQGALTTRACSQQGVLPWTNLRQSDATAACAAAGARLCTESEWQNACRGTASCTWAWQSSCTTYQTNLCNTADYRANPAVLSTGSLAECRASTSGGQVFDMSGNVREYTQARSSGSIPVRGGAYTSNGWGAQCAYDWSVVGSTFRFENVGFRCCYSGGTPP